jgi:hypothetical protein
MEHPQQHGQQSLFELRNACRELGVISPSTREVSDPAAKTSVSSSESEGACHANLIHHYPCGKFPSSLRSAAPTDSLKLASRLSSEASNSAALAGCVTVLLALDGTTMA